MRQSIICGQSTKVVDTSSTHYGGVSCILTTFCSACATEKQFYIVTVSHLFLLTQRQRQCQCIHTPSTRTSAAARSGSHGPSRSDKPSPTSLLHTVRGLQSLTTVCGFITQTPKKKLLAWWYHQDWFWSLVS